MPGWLGLRMMGCAYFIMLRLGDFTPGPVISNVLRTGQPMVIWLPSAACTLATTLRRVDRFRSPIHHHQRCHARR
jgi:hypothetical protein